jgi:1-acyl-sn-glycerol-3-phosphate acyltransferase
MDRVATAESVRERVDRLELPFDAYGVDPYGVSKRHLALGLELLTWLYRHYFRVKATGVEHVPPRGRAMLVGNHSGGIAIDGAMVIASMFLELEPPRLAQGMVDKFINRLPIGSSWSMRTGQFPGVPETAVRLLEDDRLLMVFPEGARGTAKLFRERYSLVDFGTGFMRLAMQTRTPIIPLGFVGGGEAIPTVLNAYRLGRALGVPYIPITPYGLALPLPVPLAVHYGAPLRFEGTGAEDDHVIQRNVEQVKEAIQALLAQGRAERPGLLGRLP